MCVSHIVACWIVLSGCLDGVSQEAKDGTDPQQDGEATKQLAAKFNPLRGCWGWGESIGTIPKKKLSCPGIGQALEVKGILEWVNCCVLRVSSNYKTLIRVLLRHLVDKRKKGHDSQQFTGVSKTPISSTYLDNVSLEFPADLLYRHLMFRLKEGEKKDQH